jgi:hypothetical protein
MTIRKSTSGALQRPERIGKGDGRTTVPLERQRARGNPRQRKLPDPAVSQRLPGTRIPPKPPVPLKAQGKSMWELAWAEAYTWLSRSDTRILALLCQDLDEREILRPRVIGTDDYRGIATLRALDRQITDKLQLLGFTPSDRTRLGVGEVKVVDELEEFRREAAG